MIHEHDLISALFESSEQVRDHHILRASRKIGKFRKTIGLALGLSVTDIENCQYREEDPYEVSCDSFSTRFGVQ